MKRSSFLLLFVALATFVSACAVDNYDKPESLLEGRIVYDGQPVQVRDNAIQLELWQDGYQLKDYIRVQVAQDGTFSAALFDGQYKLVRKANVGPWVTNSDTIVVNLQGNQQLDVPVTPFFTIASPSITKAGNAVNATFTVNQVVQGKEVERVALYVGKTQFVDANYYVKKTEVNTNAVGAKTLTLDVSGLATTLGKNYAFARIGVKTKGTSELIYSPVQKLDL